VMNWPPLAHLTDLTIADIHIPYEAWCVDRWQHTAQLSGLLYAVQCTLSAAHGGKPTPKEPNDFHPLLAKKHSRNTLVLKREDAAVTLKQLGRMLLR